MTLRTIRSQLTLQTRITISFVLLMAAVMLLVTSIVHVAYNAMEQYIFAESMGNEVQWLQQQIELGTPITLPEGRHLYDANNVPEALRPYQLGFHDINEPNAWHLLVFEMNGQRYYLLQEGLYFAHLESMIDGFMLLIVLLCILSAFWIGRLTSARVIAPITQLTGAIERNDKPFPYQDASDEVGSLARTFAQHSDELERFLQREQFFVGDASHELRTPLAIIAGAAETIAHQLPAGSHLQPSAERIVRTTEEMQRQLSCLLLLARDPHTVPTTEVALAPLLEECMARCHIWLAKKPVQLQLDAPQAVYIHTNAELVRSVVWNLLRNAYQYTEQGQVRIYLQSHRLTIADTGPGLPHSMDVHTFQRFGPSHAQHGEGLGLSLVQRIVEHLGWQMQVKSSKHGCRFTLNWPKNVLTPTELKAR